MDDKMMVGGCDAQVRGMDLTWLDLRFLMFSIPEGENKRGAKAESTPERVREHRSFSSQGRVSYASLLPSSLEGS